MLRPYLRIWDWDWIFGRAVKAIFSLGVRSPWDDSIWSLYFVDMTLAESSLSQQDDNYKCLWADWGLSYHKL